MATINYTVPNKPEFLRQYSEHVNEKVHDAFISAMIMRSYRDKLEILNSGREILIDYLEWSLALGKKLGIEEVAKKYYDKALKEYDEKALDILSTT